jgi:hypothetical protein
MGDTCSEFKIYEKYNHRFIGKIVWKTLLKDIDADGSFRNAS